MGMNEKIKSDAFDFYLDLKKISNNPLRINYGQNLITIKTYINNKNKTLFYIKENGDIFNNLKTRVIIGNIYNK